MTARRALRRAAQGCGCKKPAGAGLVATTDIIPNYRTALVMPWRNVPEAEWQTGAVAELAEPFPVDRGLNNAPRLVSQFVKRSNGNWLSYPGNEVYYTSLNNLSLDARISRVTQPVGVQQPTAPEPPATQPETQPAPRVDDFSGQPTPEQQPPAKEPWSAGKVAAAFGVLIGTPILAFATYWVAKKVLPK